VLQIARDITSAPRATFVLLANVVLLSTISGCFNGTIGDPTPYDAAREDSADAFKGLDAATDDWSEPDAFDAVSSFDVDLDEKPPVCRDVDRDGHPAVECGGDDCDDTNPRAYPGASEICDSRGVDEDCDPCTVAGNSVTPGDDGGTTRLEGDDDGDGYTSSGCFNRYEGRTPTGCSSAVQIDGTMRRVLGRDCDDTNANTRPEQTEVCNGRDDNCNGETDEGVQRTYFIDRDGDGFGDRMASELARMACARPVGFSETADDCDDAAASVNPAAREICDMATPPVDENCNAARNEGCDCPDGADRACMQSGVCAAGRQRCVAGRWGNCSISPSAEVCNGVDDNCDGAVDNTPPGSCRPTGAECRDGRCQCPSGQGDCGGTCRAIGASCDNGQRGTCSRSGSILCQGGVLRCNAPSATPGREVCNGLDDDCDGLTDEVSGTDCPMRSCTACDGMYPGTLTCNNCAYGVCYASIFSTTFLGTDPRLLHRCGSASGTAWLGSGCMIVTEVQYGPYLTVPAGRYRVDFDLRVGHDCNRLGGCADISVDATRSLGTISLASTRLTLRNDQIVSIYFTNSLGCNPVELRVRFYGTTQASRKGLNNLRIERTTITRL
jgi:hypothetical protein